MAAAQRSWHGPWLAPTAPALAALATASRPWNDRHVRRDPAALALLLRFQRNSPEPFSFTITAADRADLLRFAHRRLQAKPVGVPKYADAAMTAFRIATLAKKISAEDVADAASGIGQLLGLGRLVANSRSSLDMSVKIARRWGLPSWCVTSLAALAHPASTATAIGADQRIVAAVRAAVAIVEPSWIPGLDAATLVEAGIDPRTPPTAPEVEVADYASPYDLPLLPQLLQAAEKNHRRSNKALVAQLESEVAQLHNALADRQRGEADRLRDNKLNALAELAAGAGHEINTPLAVISGQAQLLLQKFEDDDLHKPLQTIVQQTRRVHEILTDLMQFARPGRPNPQVFDLALVVREVVAAVRDAANDARIDVTVPEAFVAFADPRHARSMLQSLIRNAVEAVDADGWVRVRGDDGPDGRLRITVEDSGAGPDPSIIDHIFDPFFSGHTAGRGRGLGLPTAWRLAREQGGDVRFEPTPGSPTRFTVLLPRAEAFPAGRLSA